MTSSILYSPDKTRVIGRIIEGKIVPTAPAPDGDAFDDLLLACCDDFARHPKLKGKAGDFRPHETRPDGVIVKHADALVEEVTVWIQQGDLRKPRQVSAAIEGFADHWDGLIARGAVNEWNVGIYSYWHSIKNLRWFFGVHGAKPLPTKAEVLAERQAWEAKEAERVRLANIARREDAERQAQWDAESAYTDRVKKLVKRITAKLWSFDKVDFGKVGVEEDPRYREASRKRQDCKGYYIQFVLPRIDAGKTDDEILEEAIMESLETLKGFGKSAVEPLAEGQTRRFFTDNELKVFLASGEWDAVLDTHDTVLMKGDDGLWILDTAPKSPDPKDAVQQ